MVCMQSKSLGVVGFYICVIGLASYTVKERFFVSDALIALLVGIAVGPVGVSSLFKSDGVDAK